MADLPSPPFVHIDGISNLRDVGGQPTKDGKQIVRGLIYRAADPSRASDEGKQKMSQELGMVCLPPRQSLLCKTTGS